MWLSEQVIAKVQLSVRKAVYGSPFAACYLFGTSILPVGTMPDSHPDRTTSIRAASVEGFADLVRRLGGDPAALLRQAGLDTRVLVEPDLRIETPKLVRLLEIAAVETGTEDFGLRLAQMHGLANLGPIGILAREEHRRRGDADADRLPVPAQQRDAPAHRRQRQERGDRSIRRDRYDVAGARSSTRGRRRGRRAAIVSAPSETTVAPARVRSTCARCDASARLRLSHRVRRST
jgi:hypothetical protein